MLSRVVGKLEELGLVVRAADDHRAVALRILDSYDQFPNTPRRLMRGTTHAVLEAVETVGVLA